METYSDELKRMAGELKRRVSKAKPAESLEDNKRSRDLVGRLNEIKSSGLFKSKEKKDYTRQATQNMTDSQLNRYDKLKNSKFDSAIKAKSGFNAKRRQELATEIDIIDKEFKSRGYKKASDIGRNYSPKRPHYWKKGGKLLFSKLPLIGAGVGLATSGDVSAAVDPLGSESIATDRAIEDPSSKEYKKRQRTLRRAEVESIINNINSRGK